jgi:hypothetical protein
MLGNSLGVQRAMRPGMESQGPARFEHATSASATCAPYIASGWFALGVGILVWLTLRAPDLVRAFGRVLGGARRQNRPLEPL